MEKKKKFKNRIGAFVCALVVAVSCLGASVPYYANDNIYIPTYPFDLLKDDTYSRYLVYRDLTDDNIYMWCISTEYSAKFTFGERYKMTGNYLCCSGGCYLFVLDNGSWSLVNSSSSYPTVLEGNFEILGCNEDILVYYYSNGYKTDNIVYFFSCPIEFGNYYSNGSIYNSNLGYLQNVSVNHVFEETPLGEWANDKWVSKWYFDSLSTTGIDLSSGDYSVNYYEERWIVTGYEEEDVVEKSDRYLLGSYNAQDGYFTTNSQHIEEFLKGYGYEEPSFFDLWFNKFVTTHYYLQIVDNTTGEVGGYVHIYLTDDNGSFGVELLGQTIDGEGDIDDSGYSDFINEGKITTDDIEAGFEELENNNEETVEEWLESLQDKNSSIDDNVDGSSDLLNLLVSVGQEVSSVSLTMTQIMGLFPAWMLLGFGISVALIFVAIVYKALRG